MTVLLGDAFRRIVPRGAVIWPHRRGLAGAGSGLIEVVRNINGAINAVPPMTVTITCSAAVAPIVNGSTVRITGSLAPELNNRLFTAVNVAGSSFDVGGVTLAASVGAGGTVLKV